MLLARVLAVLLCLGIGVSLILWMLTGQSQYRAWAWRLFRAGVVTAFVILSLFVLERILMVV
ncbi:MAG: hypothetical protein FWF12_01450 [Betaproteobacteria bacterium]|nr:hypothetical protein [Betaproteobacteria bacterium]